MWLGTTHPAYNWKCHAQASTTMQVCQCCILSTLFYSKTPKHMLLSVQTSQAHTVNYLLAEVLSRLLVAVFKKFKTCFNYVAPFLVINVKIKTLGRPMKEKSQEKKEKKKTLKMELSLNKGNIKMAI